MKGDKVIKKFKVQGSKFNNLEPWNILSASPNFTKISSGILVEVFYAIIQCQLRPAQITDSFNLIAIHNLIRYCNSIVVHTGKHADVGSIKIIQVDGIRRIIILADA